MVICMRHKERGKKSVSISSAYSDQFDLNRRDHYKRFPLYLNGLI